MMRALIVDDELYARKGLQVLLQRTGEFDVVGACGDAVDALSVIRKERPQVLFLDIQMPAIGGFELLSMIEEEIMPHVVFVTAYDEYAVKAFEQNALDYLLKPVQSERLTKTVQKLKKTLAEGTHPLYATPAIQRIPCLMINKVKLIPTSEVEYVRSDAAGVYVVSPKGEFFTDLTLTVLENKTKLFRCHKQFLVNLERIDEILFRDSLGAELKMSSDRTVPVSRRFLKKVKEQLGI